MSNCEVYFDEYGYKQDTISMDDLMRAKNSLAKAQVPMSYCVPTTTIAYPKVVDYPSAPKKCAQKEENDMDYNMEVDQRNHLKRRLDCAKSTLIETLREKFHMGDPKFTTKDEILAALKAGNVMFRDEYFSNDGKLHPFYHVDGTFRLTDPLKDGAGYNTAKTALDTAFTAAKDKVIVLSLTDGLAALQAFEAQTF